MAEEEIARLPRSGYARSFLAYLCAQIGERRRAEGEIKQALQLSPADVDVIWMAALTYETLGRRDAALGVLGGASHELLADLRRWPDMADLSNDSRFVQLDAANNSHR